MRTMTMIERAVAGDMPLARAREAASERGWTPELFTRKVAEVKATAVLARPRASKPAPAPAQPKAKPGKAAPRKGKRAGKRA